MISVNLELARLNKDRVFRSRRTGCEYVTLLCLTNPITSATTACSSITSRGKSAMLASGELVGTWRDLSAGTPGAP